MRRARLERSLLPLIGIGVLLLAGATAAWAAEAASARPKKADFLSEKEQSFIRPGLQFEILSATASTDGVVQMRFSVKDAAGAGLDFNGVQTPGAISIRAVLARIPSGQTLYRAYTTRTQTSPITGDSADQASFEQIGSPEPAGEGEYVYTFSTRLPADADRSRTHTIAAWAARDLSEFEIGQTFAAATFDFVPDGSAAPDVTLSVSDSKCNQCHGTLTAHDNRSTVAVCITCHQPQSVDPDTGNSVDMATMIHKIHMGEELPSVQAGEPYQIIGFRQSVHDYSHVVFPAGVRNCQTCHVEDRSAVPAPLREDRTPRRSRSAARAESIALSPAATVDQAGTPDVNRHLMFPSRRACGACHDDVNFATGENHAGGLVQPSDSQCSRCHIPQGELEFDVSVLGAHTVPETSAELPGTVFEIQNVTNTAPGQKPTVQFSIRNRAGDPVHPSDMGRLALVLTATDGGDYSQFWSENATVADGSGGTYFYTFQNAAIPDDASGTFAVGIEGYQNVTLLPGTVQERSVRDAGQNKVFSFSVSGGAASPRRNVVSTANCNSCHLNLSLHGGNRNQVEQCVLCHNPNTTDVARRPADAGAAESVNFKDMIHRIHAGGAQIRDLTIYGFGGTPHNYNEVEYPQSLANCSACHLGGTEQLPLAGDLLPTTDPRGLFNPAPPATASCTSCHTRLSAAAHAELNISPTYGEACDVCHGAGAEFAVDKSHAQ